MSQSAADRNFKNHAESEAEELNYDIVQFRKGVHPTSLLGSVAHIIKGALGAGVLSGHVSYMKAGLLVSIPINVLCGIYMGTCLYLLVVSTQTLCRRTRNPYLSYSDAGEAAMMLFPNPKFAKYARFFRYTIDAIICMDLFGACCTYQIIIAKSLKQLVENNHATSLEGLPGYPGLRVYLAMLIPLIVLICLIRTLKYLAPFSIAANVVVASCIVMAMVYCVEYNPKLEGMKALTSFDGALQFVGMQVFSMSCAGVVIPIESNMKDPKRFGFALASGMGFIIFCTFCVSFFGYAAFREESQAPITINFPMTMVAKCFKACICVMIYITHALNFWVPFNLAWYYLREKCDQNRLVFWERIFRAIFVLLIGIVAILFPNINALMGFIGCFCLSNMAFIWPNVINVLVCYERPGLGAYYWRLWRALVFIVIGIFILFCGSLVNGKELFMGND